MTHDARPDVVTAQQRSEIEAKVLEGLEALERGEGSETSPIPWRDEDEHVELD